MPNVSEAEARVARGIANPQQLVYNKKKPLPNGKGFDFAVKQI